ncbi:AbrB/MazE/SpoVT family DNA-binding domain-containing protein [Azotobacter salinestris]|uniref:AbrB/MazE/SpoVT family DNA-binding domain-containing protein n=1 Tax=Azotobacter salinestris TaxID=69964 RepID=UPI0032DE7B7D
MATATLTSKGQVTIPARVRASLGLNTGDRIEFVDLGDGKYAITAINQPVHSLKGMIRKPSAPVSIEDMNTAIAAHGAAAK